jgi:hypothetical protein
MAEKTIKDKIELYDLIRKHIQHEDSLVNQRLTWLLYSQAFLFTFFYTLFTTILKQDEVIDIVLRVLVAISFFGVVLCVLAIGSIWGAYQAIKHLRDFWFHQNPDEGDSDKDNSIYKEGKELPDITFKGKPLFSSSRVASIGIPIALILVWGVSLQTLYFDRTVIQKIQTKALDFSIEGKSSKAQHLLETLPQIDSMSNILNDLKIKVDSLQKEKKVVR